MDVVQTIRRTDETLFENTHARIKQAPNDRLVVVVRLSRGYLHYRVALDLFGRHHTELDPNDSRRSC